MKRIYYVLLLQIFAVSICHGQVSEFPPNSQPASSNVRAGQYPLYYESPGTAHEWLAWRRDLYQFAPLLFR
jgi:enterochelin esterase-like enzyme